MLKLGSGTTNLLYLGSTEINRAYLGSTLVYEKALYTVADANPLHDFDFTDDATKTYASGKISGVTDKGSEASNAAQATAARQPIDTSATLNGFKVGTFDGGDEMPFSMDLAATWSFIFIAKLSSADTQHEIIRDATTATIAMPRAIFNDNTPDFLRVNSVQNPPGYGVRVNGAELTNKTTRAHAWTAFATDAWAIVTIYGLGTTGAKTVYLGGRPSVSAASGITGDLARVIAVPTANQTILEAVEGSVAWLYGLQGNLAAGHPYELAPPYRSDVAAIDDAWVGIF